MPVALASAARLLDASSGAGADGGSPITVWQAVLIFLAMLAAVLVFGSIRKYIYRYRYKKRYFVIPRVGVKGITYIGMVIAVSVAAIIVLSVVSSGALNTLFRVFPGSRVAIEAVLIKVSGLIFGPIIGMVSGAIIDVLTVALSAGVFHYGYLISAMAYGLLAGLIRVLITYSKGNDLTFAFFASVSVAATMGIMLALLYGTNLFVDGISIKFIATIVLSRTIMATILGSFFAVLFVVVWGSYLLRFVNSKFKTSFKYFAPVVAMVVISELITNVLLLPVFDANLTTNPWSFWFGVRIGTSPLLAAVNIVVVFAVYRIVGPLIKYDYTTELVESLKTPILVK